MRLLSAPALLHDSAVSGCLASLQSVWLRYCLCAQASLSFPLAVQLQGALSKDQITVVLQVAISSQALASIDLSKLSVEELHIYLGRTSAKESEFMSGLSQARGQLQSSVGQFKSRLRNALTARSVEAKAATPGAQAEDVRKHASAGASEL